ncbi:uncharacterized protein LOC101756357 [Setaria italica]|nr:uncharacterized protein LOC101756357 [Setaria italica]
MASSTLAAHPFLPSLPVPNPSKPVSVRASVRRLPVAASAAPSGAAAAARERRRFLERYGLNPDDFEDDAEKGPREERRRDRRGRRRSGRGQEAEEAAVAPAKAAEPRETHKLLQVWTIRFQCIYVFVPVMLSIVSFCFKFQSHSAIRFYFSPIMFICRVHLYASCIDSLRRKCMMYMAHFVEMDPWVISEVLKPNLECTGFLDVSHIHMLRVEKFLANAEKSQGKYPSFDYISVTPPYLEVNYSTLLDQLARSPLVGKDCFILVEYPLKTDMAESCGNLIKIADRRFGRTNLLIYGPTWSEKKRRT